MKSRSDGNDRRILSEKLSINFLKYYLEIYLICLRQPQIRNNDFVGLPFTNLIQFNMVPLETACFGYSSHSFATVVVYSNSNCFALSLQNIRYLINLSLFLLKFR